MTDPVVTDVNDKGQILMTFVMVGSYYSGDLDAYRHVAEDGENPTLEEIAADEEEYLNEGSGIFDVLNNDMEESQVFVAPQAIAPNHVPFVFDKDSLRDLTLSAQVRALQSFLVPLSDLADEQVTTVGQIRDAVQACIATIEASRKPLVVAEESA